MINFKMILNDCFIVKVCWNLYKFRDIEKFRKDNFLSLRINFVYVVLKKKEKKRNVRYLRIYIFFCFE